MFQNCLVVSQLSFVKYKGTLNEKVRICEFCFAEVT